MTQPLDNTKVLPAISLCDLTTDNLFAIGAAIAIPVVLGYLAGAHVRKFRALYIRDVIKPSFMPPAALFGPITGIFYFIMGFASYLIYQTGQVHGVSTTRALFYYGAQLFFNVCWAPIFFRYRNPKVALYNMTLNFITAAITASKFYRINQFAGQLMIPYVAWIFLAGYVNKVIWRLNENNPKLKKKVKFTSPTAEQVAQANADVFGYKSAPIAEPIKQE